MIRWLLLGLWYAAIIFTSSLAATPDAGRPFIGYLLNKGGHVSAYLVLGWLVVETLTAPQAGLALRSRFAIAVTIAAGVVMASLDETRQTFVYGRSGQPSDVLLDTLSLSGGAMLHYWLIGRHRSASLLSPAEVDAGDPTDQSPAEHEHQQMHR